MLCILIVNEGVLGICFRGGLKWFLSMRMKRRKDTGTLRNLEPQKTSSFWYPLAKAATLGLLGRDEEGKQFAENLLKLKLNFPIK